MWGRNNGGNIWDREGMRMVRGGAERALGREMGYTVAGAGEV